MGQARDVGTVYPGASPSFRSEGLVGWQAVTRSGTGTYCLTPDAGTTKADGSLILSLGSAGGSGPPGFVSWGGYCSVTPLVYAVHTLDAAGASSDGITFTAVVP
jgi:hypothetical protein